MQIAIGNWTFTKAAGEDDKLFPVRMVANRLKLDKENQEILPQAFNKATIAHFLDHGIIDWHHQSILGRTDAEKSGAILGRPSAFKWEDGLPTVYGNLTKSHHIVQKNIIPHLEAGQKVFGASVGGSVRKARRSTDIQGKNKDQILEIDWEHLAIAASPYVISPGSEVTMVKAAVEGGVIQEIPLVQFRDVGEFENGVLDCLDKKGILYKALQAGFVTDSTSVTGFPATQTQSLEGVNPEKKDKKKPNITKAIENTLTQLASGELDPSYHEIERHVRSLGFEGESLDMAMIRLKDFIGAINNL